MNPGRTFIGKPFLYIALLLILAGCSTRNTLTSHQETVQPGHLPYQPKGNTSSEGMWLPSLMNDTVYEQFKEQGLKLSPSALYHPRKNSLNQSIVRINAGNNSQGTGSFVSHRGLVLTNHHIAYDAIINESSAEHNYLENGFYADSSTKEIPIKNYSLFITLAQEEVTEQINEQLADSLTFNEQQQQIEKVKETLIAKKKGNNKNLTIEIKDYWNGNRYFMTTYKVIRDVRLVHVPPKSIGRFGGNIDNWQWPRHTGDYTFLRAYVSPEGESTEYDSSNIPYRPGKYLPINTEGITQGDFTLTVGYPAETSRYESSYAFEFYKNHRNPVIIDAFEARLKSLRHTAQTDSTAAMANASQRASLSNALKYYRGLQHGVEKHNIIKQKQAIEQKFLAWIKKDSLRNIRYRRVLTQLDQAYDIASQSGDLLYGIVQLINNNKLIKMAGVYNEYRRHRKNPSTRDLTQDQRQNLLQKHQDILNSSNIESQKIMLRDMLYSLASLPDGKVMFYLMQLFGEAEGKQLKQDIKAYVNRMEQESIVFNLAKAEKFVALPIDSARAHPIDPMVQLYKELVDTYKFSRTNYVQHLPYLRPAQKRYAEGLLAFRKGTTTYPDANNTLRYSRGHVYGYQPRDGVYYTPFTTLQGMIAKDNTDQVPFDAPKRLEYHADSLAKIAPQADIKRGGNIQFVNFLSTNDVTGGHSGSPVLNSNGELVGLVFDSNYEGIANDYFYTPSVSRAINVDIRYIIFLLREFTEGDHLLEELTFTN